MKVIHQLTSLLIMPILCVLLISCSDSEEEDDLPVQTIRWQLDDENNVQFYTNDSQYYEYLFWNDYAQTFEAAMDTVTAVVRKVSGSLYGGFGILFCFQDNDNFYWMAIDAAGQYSVYKRVGGAFGTIIAWTTYSSGNINTGIGSTNEIKVIQTAPNNFSIYFNNNYETSFSDSEFTGGNAGFIAGIHQNEYVHRPEITCHPFRIYPATSGCKIKKNI